MLFLGKPLDLAYEKVPVNIKESISTSLLNVLTKVRDHSRGSVNTQGIYDQLSVEAAQDVTSYQQVFRLPLSAVDNVARKIVAAHRALGVVQGGTTGLAGLPGLVADIPSLYFLVFRCVEEIGLCYGFPADSEAELEHVMKIVDVGHYLESDKKRKAMIELESLQDMLRRGDVIRDVERTVIAKSLQSLSRQLATAITRRKLAQTVAIVGSVIGASVNSALINDVGECAYHAYRRRYILERAELRRRRREAKAAAEPHGGTEPPAAGEPEPAVEPPTTEPTAGSEPPAAGEPEPAVEAGSEPHTEHP